MEACIVEAVDPELGTGRRRSLLSKPGDRLEETSPQMCDRWGSGELFCRGEDVKEDTLTQVEPAGMQTSQGATEEPGAQALELGLISRKTYFKLSQAEQQTFCGT